MRIRTPNGKRITIDQYVALANRNEKDCEHSHLGCAAWHGGPCMDDLLSQQEEAARKRVADRIDGYDRDDLGESPDF